MSDLNKDEDIVLRSMINKTTPGGFTKAQVSLALIGLQEKGYVEQGERSKRLTAKGLNYGGRE